jgi:hypothetical protein
MGHHQERAEKICLNCDAAVHGHYCHACGQQNVEPRESVLHMVKHFFEDITHFDGKLFSTLKYMLTKPGFLAGEYMKGRRMKYLHPIRMYLFISAVFFITAASKFNSGAVESAVVLHARDTIEEHNTSPTQTWYNIKVGGTDEYVSGFHFPPRYAYNGAHVYDSMQRTFPESKRDNFFEQIVNRRLAAVATVYHKDPNVFMDKYYQRIANSFSKVFFISLPLFALMLLFLYWRQKRYYYVAHAIFTIHYYCFIFLSLLAWTLFLYSVNANTNPALIIGVTLAIFGGIYIYLLIAMSRFYGQKWYITFPKFLAQSVFFTLIILLFSSIFILNSMIAQ